MGGAEEQRLRDLAVEQGQDHLFASYSRLKPDQKESFLKQLGAVDWKQLGVLRTLLRQDRAPGATTLEPAPTLAKGADPAKDAKARARGEALLGEGKVAVFVVAGGQGSRLGFDGPKGLYPATPVRDKCLFQVFAEKIAALGRRYGSTPKWYVMTSQANDAATRRAFDSADCFGLDSDRVRFFSQAMLPALDTEGRILLAEPGELFLSPNGHGGSLLALRESGSLDEMRADGVEQIFYFQVDNPLTQVGDPVFLGYHDLEDAEMSTKVVPKRDAGEKVGVVGLIDGKYGVIEYSDLSPMQRQARNDDGRLKFESGNIAVHAIRREFIEKLTEGGLDLPFHLARKQIPALDLEANEVGEVEGVKFETFVFDALSQCERSVVLSVDRAQEFAPIKNADGEDSPETSRQAQTALAARWFEEAGVKVPRDHRGMPRVKIEVSPRRALDAEELANQDLGDLDFDRDVYLT